MEESRNRNRHARARPLARVQIPHEFRHVRPVGLIEREEGVAARGVGQGGDGQVGAREALCAVDDELVGLARRDGGVFGGEADVEAADGEVRVLDVEVVGVAHGAVLEDGDVDVACDGWGQFLLGQLPLLVYPGSRSVTEGRGNGWTDYSLSVHSLIGWVLLPASVVFSSFHRMLTLLSMLTKNTYVSLVGPHE